MKQRAWGFDGKDPPKGTVLVDMDGVLARWRDVPVACTQEEGYYLSLTVESVVKELLTLLQCSGWNVSILTAAYIDTHAKEEKALWLERNGLAHISRIFVPYGRAKSDYVAHIEGTKILLDDYSENLRQWERAGAEYVPIKFYNGINGTKMTWHGRFVSHTMTAKQMVCEIEDAVLF